jgi:hypothetical protein
MTGLAMLLKGFGITIDPAEIEKEFERVKVLIPETLGQMVTALNSIDKRLDRLEKAAGIAPGLEVVHVNSHRATGTGPSA